MLAIYTHKSALTQQLADSLILYSPRALNGSFIDAQIHAGVALAYAAKGDKARTLEMGTRAIESLPIQRDALRAANNLEIVADAYVLVGAKDEAFAALRQVLSVPSYLSRAFIRTDPWFEPLRADPRFKELVATP
jgi:hypothetical protein